MDYPEKLCKYITKNYFNNVYNKKILDVGCNIGIHLNGFSNSGFRKENCFGIDKTEYISTGKIIRICNLEKDKIPFENNFFDYAFSKSVIEHIYNTENFLSEIYRILKPNGKIVIMTPDWESRYKNFFEVHDHIHPFTRRALQEALKEFGFENVDVKKFYQLPLLWKYPCLKILARLTSLLPDNFKWRNKEQTIHRTWIRFSKELMLLGVGIK